MEKVKSVIFWPFQAIWKLIKLIFQSLVWGIGAALLIAVVAGAGVGLVLVISSTVEGIKTGNVDFLYTGIIGALLSGICLKILNRVIFPQY
jgi:hypothetical protein